MGCAGSRFNDLHVTDPESELVVIPESRSRYIKQEATILKLREKLFCWSGEDYIVKVSYIYNNIYYPYTICNIIILSFATS